KVSHFEVLCRVHDIQPTVGLFRCFYVNSKNKGWMSFSKRFDSSVGMSCNYTVDEDTYPKFLHDNDEGGCLLLCLVFLLAFELVFDYLFVYADMDLLAFIRIADPTKVKIGERQRAEDEPKLLDSTVGRVVLLLTIAPNHSEGELNASVDKLFDEGSSTEQGDFTVGGQTDVKRPAAADAGGSSYPPKKLKGDHGTSSRAVTGGKSPSVIRQLLVSSILNVETGVSVVATLPFVTSSVSATPKRETGGVADSGTGSQLRTVNPSARFVISSDSSYPSSTNAAEVEVDSCTRSTVPPPMMTEQSAFYDSSSAGTIRPDNDGPSHTPGKELSMGSQDVDSKTLHEVFVPRWDVSNDSLLDNHDTSRDFIDHLAPPALFAKICGIDYLDLFMEFNICIARQACLSTEVRMRTEYCLDERRRLESECGRQAELLKAVKAAHLDAQVSIDEATKKIHADEIEALKQRNVALENEKNSLGEKVTELQSSVSTKDLELKDLNATLSSLQSQNDGLVDQVHTLESTCSSLHDQLDADLSEMACHLEEKFYPHLLTIISGQRWLLTHGMKLFLVKCLNSSEYPTALGSAISYAIKQGMQSGLVAGINYGKEGRVLTNVAAYNPDAEVHFNSALRQLREMDFPLLAELKSHKDASIEDIINLLRLEGPLADPFRISDLQPDVEQLRVPTHRSDNQVVLGETSLSFTLSVSRSRVVHINENIAGQRVPASVVTTTTLSTTFASASSIPLITIEDYEILNMDGQEGVLKVRMPISIGITASVSYVSANGVSPLLDLIMFYLCQSPICLNGHGAMIGLGPTQRSHGLRKDFLYKIPFVTTYLPALRRIDLAFFFSSGRISSMRYSWIGVIHVRPSSSTIASASFSSIDFSLSSSTSTCLLKWAKLVDAILLSASAFLFSPLASLLVALNLNLGAYVNSTPSGFVSISPALKMSMHDDSSVNNIHRFLKKGNDSSADLNRNMLRLASFQFSFACPSNILEMAN
ncbi:hypothetical protein Tco_0920104, partial [Tanacetum coccineum]